MPSPAGHGEREFERKFAWDSQGGGFAGPRSKAGGPASDTLFSTVWQKIGEVAHNEYLRNGIDDWWVNVV
jgi:hypothetical protein